MHTVDLTQFYPQLDQALLILLAGLAAWLVRSFTAYLHNHAKFLDQKTDQVLADGLNRALQNGMKIAMQKLEQIQQDHPTVETKSLLGAWAAQYAANHSQDAMKKFTGLTMDQLAEKALAFLPPPTDGSAPVIPVEVKPLEPVK